MEITSTRLLPSLWRAYIKKMVGHDIKGNPQYKPYCTSCGSENLPQLILGGGAAGGGKSYLGSCWLVSSCMRFPDIRAVVARKTLKSLKGSTWNTIKKVCKEWGAKRRGELQNKQSGWDIDILE